VRLFGTELFYSLLPLNSALKISNIKIYRVGESKHNTLLPCKVSKDRQYVSALYYKAIIRSDKVKKTKEEITVVHYYYYRYSALGPVWAETRAQSVGFGGLGLACWPLVPKFAGSNLAEAVGFLRAKKSSARLRSEGK